MGILEGLKMADFQAPSAKQLSTVTTLAGGSLTGTLACAAFLWQQAIAPMSNEISELKSSIVRHDTTIEMLQTTRKQTEEDVRVRLSRIEDRILRLQDIMLNNSSDIRG